MKKTFKYKLYKSKKLRGLNETINLSGRAYNYTVARNKRYYKLFGKSLNMLKLQQHMTRRKHLFNTHLENLYVLVDKKKIGFVEFDSKINKLYWDYGFLEDIPSQALQQVTERVKNSYKLFFDNWKRKKKCSPPGFQSSRKYPSFTLKQAGFNYVETGYNEDNIIKIGNKYFNFYKSRPVDGEIKTLTIKRDTRGCMFICFSCDTTPVMTGINPTTVKMARAIDFGMKDFLVFDDGEKIKSPEFLRRSLEELKRLSRSHSKKKKGSGNREQSRLRLVKLHEKIGNQRLDWSRQMAHRICKSFSGLAGYVFIEDLNLAAMQKLWGRKISDIAYGLLVSELTRIAHGYDIKVVKIGRFDRSTGVCSETGLIRNLTLAERSWNCECGNTHDRDVESARMILKIGLDLVRDKLVRPSVRKASSVSNSSLTLESPGFSHGE